MNIAPRRLFLRTLTVLAASWLLLGCFTLAQARVYIDITKPVSRRLPLALTEFQPMEGTAVSPVGGEGKRQEKRDPAHLHGNSQSLAASCTRLTSGL